MRSGLPPGVLTTEGAVTKTPTRTRQKAGLRNLLRQSVELVRFLRAVDVAQEVKRADFPAPALPAGLRTIEMMDEGDRRAYRHDRAPHSRDRQPGCRH
jgi:hypothetical protein